MKAEGIHIFKIKVGDAPERDEQRVAAVREAAGPDARITVDANQGWWDAKTAVRAIKLLERHRIEFAEQPVRMDDLDAARFVRAHVDVPIALDESVRGPREALACAKAEACDMFVVKLMKTGGILNALKVNAIAEAAGITVMMGNMGESSIALAAHFHLNIALANAVHCDADLPWRPGRHDPRHRPRPEAGSRGRRLLDRRAGRSGARHRAHRGERRAAARGAPLVRRLMEPEELRRLWDGAGGGDPAPRGAGLLGLHVVDDPVALAGMALAVLGLPLDGAGAGPAGIRRASQRYADWLPALSGGFRAADYGDVEVVRDDPAVAFMQAHERLADIVAAGAAPLVLGGDALVSVPVLQVLTGKLRGRLGVVAFTPAYEIAPEPLYAPSSRWARALELGVVSPANLALVGGRAAPPDGPARRVLDGLGATTFSLEDVLRDGMATVAQEALETAAAGTEAVYLSVDLGVVAGIGDPVGPAGQGARRRSRRRVDRAARGGRRVRPRRLGRPRPRRPLAAAGARVAAEIIAGVARRLS